MCKKDINEGIALYIRIISDTYRRKEDEKQK